jgi:hypothetical protein
VQGKTSLDLLLAPLAQNRSIPSSFQITDGLAQRESEMCDEPAKPFLEKTKEVPVGAIYNELMAEMRWRRETEFKLLTVQIAVIGGTGALVIQVVNSHPSHATLLGVVAFACALVLITGGAALAKVNKDNRIYRQLGKRVVMLWLRWGLFDAKLPYREKLGSAPVETSFLEESSLAFGHGRGSHLTIACIVISTAIALLFYGFEFLATVCGH